MRFGWSLLAATMLPGLAVAAPPPSPPPAAAPADGYSYADLADLAGAAPLVADVTVREASRLKGADAPDLAGGRARFYVVADVLALLRGPGGIPPRVSYLVDLPLEAGGKAPKPKKARFLLFAAPVADKPGELRLIAPDASPRWTAALDGRVRAVLVAAAAADAPPRITGVAKAFHTPGSLPGESETQIFLATADSRPVSLTVERHPDEPPRWAVALGELADEAAAAPAPDTLLWYRLACFLPRALPDAALAELSADDAAAARADYGVVLAGLGACARTHGG